MAERAIRVLAAGMVGSSSTFIYNVAREILASDPHAPVFAAYADEWSPLLLAHRRLVVKSHWGILSLLPEARRGVLLPIVSVRHPGDCLCSDVERFGFAFDFALQRVTMSLRFCAMLMRTENAALFRYEDGFASSPDTAPRLANRLGLELPAERLAEITRRYDTDGTRAYAESLEHATGLTSNPDNPGGAWCPTTHIHKGHIGKLTSGRWRALPADQRQAIQEACGDLAQSFGYDCAS
jgi:hypothetical protein